MSNTLFLASLKTCYSYKNVSDSKKFILRIKMLVITGSGAIFTEESLFSFISLKKEFFHYYKRFFFFQLFFFYFRKKKTFFSYFFLI